MTDDLTQAIRTAEQQRCAAMLSNDSAALGAMLDPRLHFAHANGGVDDKAVYLAKMASGRINYKAINWSEEAVIELADGLAMLTGRMETDVQVEGADKSLRNRVISIWGNRGGGWRLIAFQSTPLAS